MGGYNPPPRDPGELAAYDMHAGVNKLAAENKALRVRVAEVEKERDAAQDLVASMVEDGSVLDAFRARLSHGDGKMPTPLAAARAEVELLDDWLGQLANAVGEEDTPEDQDDVNALFTAISSMKDAYMNRETACASERRLREAGNEMALAIDAHEPNWSFTVEDAEHEAETESSMKRLTAALTAWRAALAEHTPADGEEKEDAR